MTEPREFDRGTVARNLRGLESRMQYRVEAIEIRDGKGADAITGRGVGISYLLAKDVANALGDAATLIEGFDRIASIWEDERIRHNVYKDYFELAHVIDILLGRIPRL